MEENGGETRGDNKKISANYINPKIAIYTVVVVVLGLGVLATMIYVGVNLAKSRQPVATETPASSNRDSVRESIEIEYDETKGCYAPSQEYTNAYKNSLMHRYGVDDKEYAIIRTNSELKDFINAVNSSRSSDDEPFVYDINDDFFKTGVLIAIAKEETGLESMYASQAYRDENYNLQIYIRYIWSGDAETRNGKFSLLQIQNIQPKNVDIVWNSHSLTSPYPTVDVKKPIIYLYPTKTTSVEVKLSNPERITVDYPDYNNGWKATAYPDGTLVTESGKKLYALYYESLNTKKYTNKDLSEGFVVAKDEVEEFLDEKLNTLGLSYKEREEFISFQTKGEIERNMGLQIQPKPDVTIRVMMEYKKLDHKIDVKAQKLQTVERKGFTVVEWGGTEIK